MSEREPKLDILPNFDSFVDHLDVDAIFAAAPDPIEVTEKGFDGMVMVREESEFGSNSPDGARVGGSSLDSVKATLRWGLERKALGYRPRWTIEFEESYANYDSTRRVSVDMLSGELTGEQRTLKTSDRNPKSVIKSQGEKIKIASRIAEILKAN